MLGPWPGERDEPPLYQRIPWLLGRTITRVLLSRIKTKESSKDDQSHRSAFHFHFLMTQKESFTNILKQRRLAVASLSTSLTQKDILYQARASATQQLCYAFLTEPPLCFRRKNCILKRQQYQFCINTGFSRRGQMSIKRNSDFFFFLEQARNLVQRA